MEIGGPWSRELCGGTHVERSSQIGTVVLTSESSVGSGNRRVEALVGIEGFDYLAKERDLVAQLTSALKVQPDQLQGRIEEMVQRLKSTEKELEKLRLEQLLADTGRLAGEAIDLNGTSFVGHLAKGAAGGDVRSLAMDIRGKLVTDRPAVTAVLGDGGGRVAVVVALNDAAQAAGLSANDLVRAASTVLGGKGGGKPDLAQGGGSDPAKAGAALDAIREALAKG